MVTRKSWRRWVVPFVCVWLAAIASGAAQPPTPTSPTPPAVPSIRQNEPTAPVAPPGGLSIPASPTQPTPAPAPTIDQLMGKLEQVRKQKAELEKEEQAVTAQLRTAIQKQKKRLAKLGIEELVPPADISPLVAPTSPGK